jgi:ABC-type multidrug transport system ATPase subunit
MTPAVTVSRLHVVLGDRVVIDDASFTVNKGEAVVVIGKSGAGKSVLWKAVAGLIPRRSGSVRIGVGPLIFVHQDPALMEDRSVYENLRFGVNGGGLGAVPLAERLAIASRRLNLEAFLDTPAFEVSPALARRVALARALIRNPGVLIVDEPTTGLDVVAAADVDNALVAAARSGTTLIVISHHARTWAHLREHLSARTVVVDDGRLRELPPHHTSPLQGAQP